MKTNFSFFLAIFVAVSLASQMPVNAAEKPLTFEEKSLLLYLSQAKQRPNEYGYCIKLNWDLYRIFKSDRHLVRAKTHLRQLYEEIRKIEALPKPSQELIWETSTTLNEMSLAFCPPPESNSRQALSRVSAQAFLLGESLQKRELKMMDKLPLTDEHRLYAHQLIVSWYRSFGKNQAAEREEKILISLAMKNMNEENAREAARTKAGIDAMMLCRCKCKYRGVGGGFH